jgi:hypothetical protein
MIRRRLPFALAGIALGLAMTFTVLCLVPGRPAPRATPAALGGPPLAEVEGAITEVLFHFLPEMQDALRAPYTDFLGTLPARTRLVAIVPREGGAASLRPFLDSIDPDLYGRTQVVPVPGPISPWSKDRALVLGPGTHLPITTLLTPLAPPAEWERRRNDWHTVATFAATREEYVARPVPLDFDAGDFAVTPRGVLVDANLITKNHARRVDSPRDLETLLEPLLGTDVIVIGTRDGDVPRHHLSMYMTPLGRNGDRDVVLVGDPRLARDVVTDQFVPGEIDPDTGRLLRADFSPTMIARHDRAAAALAQAGFEVVRIPTVPFLDKTYMAYTNGIFGTWGARRIAWVPTFEVPELDRRAHAVYARLGWEVRPVRVRSVYAYHGTIGCLANVIARGTHRV